MTGPLLVAKLVQEELLALKVKLAKLMVNGGGEHNSRCKDSKSSVEIACTRDDYIESIAAI